MLSNGTMPRRPRLQPQRFSIGDVVQVNAAITSVHVGELGTVIAITSSRYSRTLDKYAVRLESGTEKLFWDIQLAGLAEISRPV
jgi:hypothetical protein